MSKCNENIQIRLLMPLHNKIVDACVHNILICAFKSVHKRPQMRSHKNAFCTYVYTTEYSENSWVH